MSAGARKDQKTTDPLQLELQVAVGYLRGMLGTESESSSRAR